MFFHQREIQWRWKDTDAFVFWLATHTKEGEEVVVINDGPGDDANVEEIWIGGCPDGREEYVQDQVKKRKGGPK